MQHSPFEGAAIVWDAKTGEELVVYKEHQGGVSAVGWSPDSQRIASGSDAGETLIWDVTNGKTVLDLYPENFGLFIVSTSWSPDGSLLATNSGDGLLTIWDSSSGEEIHSMPGHTGAAWRISWFPDSNRLLSADATNEIKIWDVTEGTELASFYIEDSIGAWLSPDGQQVLSAVSPDGPLVIFNIWQSLEELVEITNECCVVRDLMPEEREQFGLTLQE